MLNDPDKPSRPKLRPIVTDQPEAAAEVSPAPALRELPAKGKMPRVRRIEIPTGPKLPVFAAVAQGFFCVVVGVWPVAGLASLERITGQRGDRGSLTLAGLLLATIGLSMIITAIRRDVAFEVYVMGIATAVSLGATDVIFVIERSIPAVYLLDAVAETLFVTLWVFAIRDKRRASRLAIPGPPSGAGPGTEREERDGPG